jgi:hypothetical protein
MKAMKSSTILAAIVLAASCGANSQTDRPDTSDQSHCLTLRETRSDKDASISCNCRLRIADARYLNWTYIETTKDLNLSGVLNVLERLASEACGPKRDVAKAISDKQWEWNGPEVVRTYPPEDQIKRIKPDGRGLRHVPFTVQLLTRDAHGRVMQQETFEAQDLIPATEELPRKAAPQ